MARLPIMKKPALIALGTLVFPFSVFSQNEPVDPTLRADQNERQGDERGLPRFWQAKLLGGEYVVALDRIVSVSRHKYVLDGALIVDEVTVDTVGGALARFYHITPITAGVPGAAAGQVAQRALSLVDGAARTAGSELQDMVVKQYPLTTHARTIEYRLLSEEQLNTLFESVRTSWQSGRGRVFTGR
jgi:hypothetical protein